MYDSLILGDESDGNKSPQNIIMIRRMNNTMYNVREFTVNISHISDSV